MNTKRLVSALIVATIVQLFLLSGCNNTPKEPVSSVPVSTSVLTIIDKDGNTISVLGSLYANDAQTDDEGYTAYLERVVYDAVKMIESTDNCSENEARTKLQSEDYTIFTAFDSKVYEAIKSEYTDLEMNTVPFGCAVTDLNGNVCALYSAGDYGGQRNYSTSLLSPYSSFKPLSVYAQAVDSGIINWSTIYEDSPYKVIDGSDWPVNATGTYLNSGISVYNAIAQSLNTVAVKCLNDVGVNESIEFLIKNFDIDLSYERNKALKEGEEEVIGNIALGYLNVGVSPLDMAGYYQIFANKGIYKAPCTVVKICTADGKTAYENNIPEKQVIKETTAGVMNLLLRGVVSDGTGRAAFNPDIPFAGKTGTGNSDDGNWFVGVSPGYSCAVWHGEGPETNRSPEVFGGIMSRLCGESEKVFDMPLNLKGCIYCVESGLAAGNKCARIEMGYYVADATPGVCDAHK